MIGIDMMKNKGILAIAFSFLVISISFAGVVTSGKQITEDEPNLWQHLIFQTSDLKVVSIPFSQQSQLGKLIDQCIDIVDVKDSKVTAHINNIELEWLYESGFKPEILFKNVSKTNRWMCDPELTHK